MEEKTTDKKAYTFSDVYIKPGYSDIGSRKKDVDLTSDFGFFKLELPIIAANMKTICGPKMAIAMAESGGMGALHRFGTIDQAVLDYLEVKNHFENPASIVESYSVGESIAHFNVENNLTETSGSCSMSSTVKSACERDFVVGVSVGVQEEDKERFDRLYEASARIFFIDIAHGHSLGMKNILCWIRSRNLKDIYIIAGNVATPEGAYDLAAEWGADCVKVGIGPGCFTPDMLVRTNKGLKKISEIKNGDFVYSHKGRLSKVINTIKYKVKEKIFKINNISCTRKHLFYVINKKDSNKVNEDNIETYAKWVSAKDLNNDYLLVKIKD